MDILVEVGNVCCEVSRAVLVRVITPQCCDVVRVAMHSCFGKLRLVPLHRLSVPRSIATLMVVCM